MPEYDLKVLLVNDPQYGGSGGSVLISSLHIDSAEIVRHESGHTFGNLTDEYTNAYPGFVANRKAECHFSNESRRDQVGSLDHAATPIPTPQTPPYALAVGLFEGAEYQTTGWYRPKLDCKMNHLGIDFCEWCAEQLVKSAYQLIDPIDSFSRRPLTSWLPHRNR